MLWHATKQIKRSLEKLRMVAVGTIWSPESVGIEFCCGARDNHLGNDADSNKMSN